MEAVALSKNFIVPVYIPTPGRFAVHKMFSAISRTNQFAKSDKDLLQAATIICALEAKYPGDIAGEMKAFPTRGRTAMLKGARRTMQQVRQHSAQVCDALQEAISVLDLHEEM